VYVRPPYQGPATWMAPPVYAAPSPAPAWRWHGYGAANGSDLYPSAPVPNYAPQQQSPAQPERQLHAPTPMPMQEAIGPPWQPPVTTSPIEAAPMDPPPMSSAEPVWHSAGQRMSVAPASYFPAPTAPAGRDLWTAAATVPTGTYNPMTVVQVPPATAWRGSNTVTAVTPMPPGSYTPRAVSDAGVQPAAFRPAAAAPAVQPAVYRQPSPQQAAPPPAPPAVKRPSGPPPVATETLTTLKAGIERVCVGKASGLEVYARGPTSLLVRLKVRQASDAPLLANRISQMPELGPYQVLYEMQVAR